MSGIAWVSRLLMQPRTTKIPAESIRGNKWEVRVISLSLFWFADAFSLGFDLSDEERKYSTHPFLGIAGRGGNEKGCSPSAFIPEKINGRSVQSYLEQLMYCKQLLTVSEEHIYLHTTMEPFSQFTYFELLIILTSPVIEPES